MDLYVLNWTAMQAVSAVEARLTFPGEAVLIAEPRVRDLQAVDRVPWTRQHWLEIRIREAPLRRVLHWQRFRQSIAAIVDDIGPVERIFVGHLGAPMCHVVNVSGAREVIVLDAGLVTEKVAKARPSQLTPSLRTHAVRAARRLLGLQTQPPPRVTFFTSYHLKVDAPDRLMTHRFDQLRSSGVAASASPQTWFIGQNFVEGRLMSPERYEAFVAQAIAGLDNVTYVAHPRESPERAEVLRRRFGFAVTRFDKPLEIEMLTRPWPQTIVGISSSALHSAALIAGSAIAVRALRLQESDLLKFVGGLPAAYEQLARVGVDIFEAQR